MPLKLTCPTCSQPTRLSEPYPLPGAEIMCTSCGVAMTVSYPTGVIQKLRDRGKTFAEDVVVAPPPPPAPHLGRSIHPSLQQEPPEPTTSHEPTELASPQAPPAARSIDLDSIPSGPVKRRRPPPPMTMPSFSMADPDAGDPDSDVPADPPRRVRLPAIVLAQRVSHNPDVEIVANMEGEASPWCSARAVLVPVPPGRRRHRHGRRRLG